jgi:hypothetical protein
MISGGLSDFAAEFPFHQYQTFAVEWLLEKLFAEGQSGSGLFLDPG